MSDVGTERINLLTGFWLACKIGVSEVATITPARDDLSQRESRRVLFDAGLRKSQNLHHRNCLAKRKGF